MVGRSEDKRVCRNCLRFEPIVENIGKCRLTNKQVNAEDSCADFCDDIEFLNTKSGWAVIAGRNVVAAFNSLEDVDPLDVAEKLRVEPKEIFKAKMRVYRKPSTPINIDDSFIELENLTIQPIFNGLAKRIHPAIGVVDGIGYVGVHLPCIITSSEEEAKEKELPFLITSNGKKILCNQDVLSRLKWKLEYRVVSFENRWSLESVKGFLNGTAKVDPATVYKMVKNAWKTYIEFDNPIIYDFLTLWTIGTYFFHLFNAYPYVYIGGLKRSGKTKVLTVASLMCFNAIFSNNLSTSAIFRLIQSGRCTLLMDETEKLANKERASELRNLLLSGYKQGAKVYRVEKTTKERLVPEAFEVYSPKMIANIRGIEDVLEDRCITIIMKRGKNKQILNSEPSSHDLIWQEIRDKLYILYLKHWKEILSEYQKLSEGSERSEGSEPCGSILDQISDRERELWNPIICMASFFDKYLLLHTQPSQHTQPSLKETIIEFAVQKVKEKQVENVTETRELILVQTLLELVQKDGYYKVKTIKDVMDEKYEEEQKWLRPEWVGRALKRLGFLDKHRIGRGVEYYLKREVVEDLAERLGIKKQVGSHTQQTEKVAESTKNSFVQEETEHYLTRENFELVYKKLRELCKYKLY
ncbi:hypothetical protein DRO54_07370, partial [Candidatus Bathyarchaeota archaeon]